MLTNPVYTGVVYIGRTRPRPARRRHSAVQPVGRIATTRPLTAPEEWTPVATVPALVSPDLFARVQAKLAENRRFAPRNNTRHHYLLRALVSCGLCRLSCTGRGGTRPGYSYYVCKAKSADLNACRDARCPGRFIPSQQLDTLVWEDLCAVLTHPEQITQALARAHAGAWAPQELQARRDVLRQGRAGLVQRLDRLTEAYLGAVIPLDEYRRRRGELEGRLQALDEQERQVEAQAAHQLDLAGLVDSLVAFCTRV
jgi:site-specific DNA recombinase